MEALLQSLAARYGYEYAAKLLGIDKQTQNPKYAISMGGNTLDIGNMAKRVGLNQGIKSLTGGKLGGILGPGLLMGGALMLGRAFDPTRPGSRNYNPNLAGQIIDLKKRGMLNDRNQITSGPLAGKNLVSMFGTNDYGEMMDDKVGYFTDRIAAGKNYSQQNYEDALVESGAGGTRGTPTGPVSHVAEGIFSQKDYDDFNKGSDNDGGSTSDGNSPGGGGSYCFDPSTPIQMSDGSTKKIKNIQLGDNTKGGEVTGVFQFKASDEIHDYKGVTVAGSHYVKEDGRFIMVKDSPLAVKIDKIPVVYSLDTTGRRIFINDIEFADYNGDGVAKNFLNNAGINVPEFNKEVLRQVEQRLI
jgi:hypothetical protein